MCLWRQTFSLMQNINIHSTFYHSFNGNIWICYVVCDLQMVDSDFQIKSARDAFFHSFQDKLSPFLRFGCLSPRTVYHALSQVYQKVGGLDYRLQTGSPYIYFKICFRIARGRARDSRAYNGPCMILVLPPFLLDWSFTSRHCSTQQK